MGLTVVVLFAIAGLKVKQQARKIAVRDNNMVKLLVFNKLCERVNTLCLIISRFEIQNIYQHS